MSEKVAVEQRGSFEMVDEDAITEIVEDVRPSQRSPYGKLKVLLMINKFAISIGPDYCLFVPAFSFFVISGFFMTKFVFSTTESVLFRVLTVMICGLQPLTYLLTALLDPGVVTESVPLEGHQQEQSNNRTFKECKKCNIWVRRDTYHCSQCQVCILQYDHHCPWVSKCIGKNNLTMFYIFLAMTPAFFVYCMVAFFVCASLSLAQHTH